MPKTIALFEELLSDAKVNDAAYNNLVQDILKSRQNAKLNQAQNLNRLTQYATYGKDTPAKAILSEEELSNMNPQVLIDKIKQLNSFEHKILYYGPDSEKEIIATINKHHKVPSKLKPIPTITKRVKPITEDNKVLLAQYDANQIIYTALSTDGMPYNH